MGCFSLEDYIAAPNIYGFQNGTRILATTHIPTPVLVGLWLQGARTPTPQLHIALRLSPASLWPAKKILIETHDQGLRVSGFGFDGFFAESPRFERSV